MKNRFYVALIIFSLVFFVNSIFSYLYFIFYFIENNCGYFRWDVYWFYIDIQLILIFIYSALLYLFKFDFKVKSCLCYLFFILLSSYTIYCLNKIYYKIWYDHLNTFADFIVYAFLHADLIALFLFNIFLTSNLVARKLRDRMA
jgi:hypothetical protein